MNKTGMKMCLKCMVLLVICMVVMLPAMHVNAQKTAYSIKVNRRQNIVTIYKKDANGKYTVPVKAMVCSVGMQNRTPKGTFRISNRYRWRALFYGTYGQYATRIHGNILFHSVGYNRKDPSSLQYKEYNKLGTAASHGCVRLSVEDAKWIYNNCKSGTKVVIYDSDEKEPLEKPNAIKIPNDSKLQKWDPTDPNKKNPWRKVSPTILVENKELEANVSTKQDLLHMATAFNYKGKEVKVNVKGKYNLTQIGSYTVTFTAVDSLGNMSQKTVKIRVGDTIAPIVKPVQQDSHITLSVSELKELIKKEDEELTAEELKALLKQQVVVMDQGKEISKEFITVNGVDDLLADYKKYLQDANFKFKEQYRFAITAQDETGNRTKKALMLFLQIKDERFIEGSTVTI